MIDSLRTHHQVYVLTFDDPVRPVGEEALRPYVQDLHIIRYALTLRDKFRDAGIAVAAGYRFTLPRRVWMMRRLVAEWSERYAIDVLHCGWTAMGAYFNATHRPVVRVLDEVDIRFRVEEHAVERGAMAYKTARKNKALELSYCRQADFVITRSIADRTVLTNHIADLDVLVLPPFAHTTELLSMNFNSRTNMEVLFVGAMNRTSNQDAVNWFVHYVWGRVRDLIPQAIFTIVGADPTPEILELRNQVGVQVIGYVPDVCPYYQKARVVIAPMRVPSGQLNKLMDGLTAGRPVVATAQANRGTNAPCVVIAETPKDFAAAVSNLLLNRTHWQEVAEASRRFAQTNFRWSTDQLEAHYETYLRRKQP